MLFLEFLRGSEEMLVKDLDKLKFIDIKETETGFDIYSFGHYALSTSKDDFAIMEIDLDFMNDLLSIVYTDGYTDAMNSELY